MPERVPRWSAGITQHRLTFVDQIAFELHRVTGRNQLMQCLWVYDAAINLAALQSVYDRLCALRANRLIEPSAIPFGRPRWVRDDRPSVPVHVEDTVRPRTALLAWANAHARTPIDPVTGPAWHIAVQRFSDGSQAISMVGSHLLSDGMYALQSIRAAIAEIPDPSPYRARGERGRLAGWWADLCQASLDAPMTLKALGTLAAGAMPRPRRAQPAALIPPAPVPVDAASVVELPAVTVVVDLPTWNTRARALGGHSQALLLAFCARIAQHQQRLRPSDGTVSLVIPIDQRDGATDDRALAVRLSTITLDPEPLTGDIRPAQQAMMSALRAGAQQTNDTEALLPVVAWIPGTTTAALVNRAFRYESARPVTCSIIGELSAELGAIDGTPCQSLITRAVDVQVTLGELERTHGHLVIVASRYNGRMSICIEAYQPGAVNSSDHLRDIALRTLHEFGLDGEVEC
jgi:hypothetical protein